MKKKLGMLLAVILTFCMTVGVFADAGKTQQVDYKTDYYMIVGSPDGGVDKMCIRDRDRYGGTACICPESVYN